jgi:two-component system sensor histidine kinase TctE
MTRSLRFDLVGWLGLPLAGLVLVNLWTTYGTASRTATLATDRALTSSAHAMAEEVSASDDGVIDAPIPPIALEMFASGYQDHVYYAISRSDGRLVSGYADMPPVPAKLADWEQVAFAIATGHCA